MGFNSYVWEGCGTKNVKNCSHGLKFFISYFVADVGNRISLENHVFGFAYVKDLTDSMQNPFSPHKTYDSHGPFYLNVSEQFSSLCQSLFFLKFLMWIIRILNNFFG